MILSDGEIKFALSSGLITIAPPPVDSDYSPSAVDLHLGEALFAFRAERELDRDPTPGVERHIIVNARDVDVPRLVQQYSEPLPRDADGSFVLDPGRFVLGATEERIALPIQSKLAARVEGRSSLARLGLIVHLTAPTIHAGFTGNIVLEMYHFGPYRLRLTPGLAICQLIFERLGEVPEGGITTTFQGQTGPRG